MDLQPIFDTWAVVGDWLSRPGVVVALLMMIAAAAVALLVLVFLIPWLINHHLDELTDRLISQHDYRFRAKGLRRASITLIARCLAWVFGLKLCSELAEPFVASAWAATTERYLLVTYYDWVVTSFLILVVLWFWARFTLDVRRHDAIKASTAKINRNLTRTIPLFWKPAIVLLILLFLPDVGKRATTWAADAVKGHTAALTAATTPQQDDPQRHAEMR